ncbi:unnamed protein product [Thelazia callipaeda]|uniref:EGF-like domain-containing protein n=1 Tax=Thelazia callipaeda TaxID=103827 RepID=A0A0N5D297_THECL|nr:unnamed protein product [Thelazia callipaeda]
MLQFSETSTKVKLPENYECYKCAIRAIQTTMMAGKSQTFYSCADVNIVSEILDGDTCLGNGLRNNGICECIPQMFGNNCQYQYDCINNANCNNYGQCISFPKEALKIKQCFCQRGYFGKNCLQESKSFTDDSEFIPSLYQLREVGKDKDKIYWRILQVLFYLNFS